jgi:hypothetical protein
MAVARNFVLSNSNSYSHFPILDLLVSFCISQIGKLWCAIAGYHNKIDGVI